MTRPCKHSKLTYGNFINIRGGIIDYYKRINHSVSDILSTWKKLNAYAKILGKLKVKRQ